MSKQGGMRLSVRDTMKRVAELVCVAPSLVVPFVLVGLANAASLMIAFLSPRYPVSIVMAPPIARFYGEEFLHYPRLFSLIPKLFQQGSLLISLTFGLIMTAYALYMLESSMKGEQKFDVFGALGGALKNFVKMLIVFLVFYGIAKFLGKGALMLLRQVLSSAQGLYLASVPVDIIIITVVQSCAFMVFPAFIMGRKKFFSGVSENIDLFANNTLPVLLLVFIPSLLFLLSRALFVFNAYFMQRFGVEFMLVSLSFTIVINVIVDIVVTLCSGVAYRNLTSASGE